MNTMLGKISQTQGTNNIKFFLYERYSIGKFVETESRLEITRGWGAGSEEPSLDGHRVPAWGHETVRGQTVEMRGGCTTW